MSFFVEGCLQSLRLACGEGFAVLREGGEEGYEQRLLADVCCKGFFELQREEDFHECRSLFVLFANGSDFAEGEDVSGVSQVVDEGELREGKGYEGLRADISSRLGCARVCTSGCKQEADE